jgi:RND family efflux transporter MFP subunit
VEHLVGTGALPPAYDEHWVLIRAPIDGVVVSREAQPGSVVLVGAPLLTVSRTSALTLVVQLPDAAVAAARVGAPVRFTVGAYPGRAFDAKVTRVFPAIDTLTRTVELQAAVYDPEGALRAEMYATAELLGPSASTVLTVPAGAIQAFDGDTVVIEAQQRGEGMRLEAMRVRTGRRTRERVEIVTGIDSGRLVVVGGASIAKAEILKRRGGE